MQGGFDRRYLEFVEFLKDFIQELNRLSLEGALVLVEGARDIRALRDVGYAGSIESVSSVKRQSSKTILSESKTLIILTDLDREGGRLAVRYAKMLGHSGSAVSLLQRGRLLTASKGVFRHIENLKRFAEPLAKLGI